MNPTMVTDVNLTPLEVREHGLRIEVSPNTPASTQLQIHSWAPSQRSREPGRSLVGSSQSVVNHRELRHRLPRVRARDGRTYQLEREGVLPLYNLYIGDVVVDSIWVD